jgi:hypothetical protein
VGRECRTHSGKKRKDKAISLLAGGEVAPAPQKELGTSCLFCITPAPGLLQKTAANSMRMRRTAGHVAIMSLLLYGKRQLPHAPNGRLSVSRANQSNSRS